jgi:uncharacterized protein
MGGGRDRDPTGRARNARARDKLGRPLDRTGDPALPDEVALPPDQALERAQTLLDDGRPFTAHEVLEAVWKNPAVSEPELWRGLAQVAVGITHALRGNESGARALLQRGADTLTPLAGTTSHHVDVDRVRAWALAAAADLTLVTPPPRLQI